MTPAASARRQGGDQWNFNPYPNPAGTSYDIYAKISNFAEN